jgi:predicted porin
MEKRKIQTSLIALGVAAALGTPLQAAAQDTGIQFYGHFDLSFDVMNKGIKEGGSGQNPAPIGSVGWQPDISSNLSYLGFRGDHDIGGGTKLVFQAETQMDVSATPGPNPVSQASQGNVDNKVQGALVSRNSFLGIASGWGALKLGKTDAPYKLSTARMDPFSATIGDYNSIMGNTGGDNRAEFDTRLSHAVWYESPKMGAFSFSALWAPGQNRATDNGNNASGEPDCTGGGGGQGSGIGVGLNIGSCQDGSFGDAFSAAFVYEAGNLYAILAGEYHDKVNRISDDAVNVGVADESAAKAGVQYKLSSTIINAIYEKMIRRNPNPGFNERQREGWWLAATQKFGDSDEVSIGWAHASKTPGQPGGGAPGQVIGNPGAVDNSSNMYTLGYKHHWTKRANWYAVYAMQKNGAGGHYDLGASGHGITTDCKDAGNVAATPPVGANCFTGETLTGVSVGMMYSF